jgi:hypothetical protein
MTFGQEIYVSLSCLVIKSFIGWLAGDISKVVALDPNSGRAYQGRGLVRALTGNLTGATQPDQAQEKIALWQRWTEALKAHHHPFTMATLAQLRYRTLNKE